MSPKHFQKVMNSPYFRMDNQVQSTCKCFECRVENLFIKFFNIKKIKIKLRRSR
jgi:hypothetical protein